MFISPHFILRRAAGSSQYPTSGQCSGSRILLHDAIDATREAIELSGAQPCDGRDPAALANRQTPAIDHVFRFLPSRPRCHDVNFKSKYNLEAETVR